MATTVLSALFFMGPGKGATPFLGLVHLTSSGVWLSWWDFNALTYPYGSNFLGYIYRDLISTFRHKLLASVSWEALDIW